MCETPLQGVASNSPALVTGLREQLGGGLFHRTVCRLVRPAFPLVRAAYADALAECLLCFGRLYCSGSRNITGALLIAIAVPFEGARFKGVRLMFSADF